MKPLDFVQPEGFLPAKGYSNGVVARDGDILFVAGQVGWNTDCRFESDDLVEQFGRALDNVLAIVKAAGGSADRIARMTIYVTDLPAYRASLREIGRAWRERLGKHYPAMALVGVSGLVEARALVEIEATAIVGERTAAGASLGEA